MNRLAWTQRWPAVPLVLPYLAGIVAGRLAPSPIPVLCLGTAFFLLGALGLRLPIARKASRVALGISLGWLNCVLQTDPWRPDDLRIIVPSPPELVVIEGVVQSPPEVHLPETKGRARPYFSVELAARAVQRAGFWQPARGRLLVTTPGLPGDDLHSGMPVQISGVLAEPDGPVAPGLFDYQRFLETQGIHFLLRADSTNDWCQPSPASGYHRVPWPDRFRRWGQQVLAHDLPATNDAVRLQSAMVLGTRAAMTPALRLPFTQSGTMHIFAISGLHIMLAAEILVQLLRVLQLPRASCALVVGPVLWFYTAATGWQPSAVRSTIMMSVILGSWLLRRPGDLLNSLAVAALLILAWDPVQLFAAGFQLSFCVVLSLALFLPPLERLRDQWIALDPYLPDTLRTPWQIRAWKALRYVATSAAVSLAAWIGSLPLVAFYFNLVTPVSLLANLVVVPLSTFALMCGVGSLACGAWTDTLTSWFNHAGWFWMDAMITCARAFAALPGAWWPVATPSGWLLATYTVSSLSFGCWLEPALRIRLRTVAPLFAAFPLGLLLCALDSRLTHGRCTVTLLAVRSGESMLLAGPDPSSLCLVDCGDEPSARNVVAPFLRTLGLRTIPHLVLTHGDVRHVGGTPALLEQIRVARLLTSHSRSRSKPYQMAIETAAQHGASRQIAVRGTRFGPWEVLHPSQADAFTRADDQAIVLRGRFGRTTVLLVSDLGPAGQRALLEREPDLGADILVAGTPNGTEPLGEVFLDAVRPRLLLVQSARFPASQMPSRAVRSRLERRRLPVWFTHERGTVTLELAPGYWRAAAMDGSVMEPPD